MREEWTQETDGTGKYTNHMDRGTNMEETVPVIEINKTSLIFRITGDNGHLKRIKSVTQAEKR